MSTLRHRDDVCEVWQGDAREVASSMADGSCSLAIVDGPYAMGKADWDKQGLDGLVDWYRPHLEDVGRVCAPSASMYLWNTAEGWARLDPLIRSMGWTFRALVTWDKTIAHMAGRVDTAGLRTWFDITEVCGFYQREEWAPSTCAGSEIANAAGADPRNWVRLWLREEWFGAGLKAKQADEATGVKTQASRHYFPADQWSLPTWEKYQRLAEYAAEHGEPRERPYLVHPDIWPDGGHRETYDHLREKYDHLREKYDHLREKYDHLRETYEASRPAFTCPLGTGNVWTHPPVAGRERLRHTDGKTLHPCQKPVAFARRMIEASTRPGERVWVPFGGTLRECVAARDIAMGEPSAARSVVTAELDMDGRDYITAALRQYHGQGTRPVDPRQRSMF
jgi:DNA modification methylase